MQKKRERILEEEQMQKRKESVQSQMSATTIYHSLSLFLIRQRDFGLLPQFVTPGEYLYSSLSLLRTYTISITAHSIWVDLGNKLASQNLSLER